MRDTSWDLTAIALSVYDADGFLGIQVDAEGTEASGVGTSPQQASPGQGGVADYEAIFPGGLLHRPVDPVSDANGTIHAAQACQGLKLSSGGRSWAMPLTDPRVIALLPVVNKGDTLLYSGCGAFHRIGAEGMHALMTTTDGTPNGQTVAEKIYPTMFERSAPWGVERFDANGWHLNTASGASIDVGGMNVAGPASAFGSYCDITAATIDLHASVVTLGPDSPTGHWPVVLMNPVLETFLADLMTTLTALAAVFGGFTGTGAFPAAPAAQALVVKLAAEATALQQLAVSTSTAAS